jgi:hypothetical protein
MLLGFALSHLVDSAIPGLDHDVDVGLDLDHDGHISTGEHVLGWLHVGHVPVLILFVILLLGFGLVVNLIGGLVQRTILRDESTAVSAESLVGHSATITLGATKRGTPSQAKLKDKHGQTHYVMVEPMHDDLQYEPGQSVLLVERTGHKYLVIEDSVDALLSFGANTPAAENRQSTNNV